MSFSSRKVLGIFCDDLKVRLHFCFDVDVNATSSNLNSFKTKLEAMEDAKEVQCKSALTSAISSIVAGSVPVGMATGSGILSGCLKRVVEEGISLEWKSALA